MHRQLKYSDRLIIEALLKEKHTYKQISKHLHIHISTVYREIKRGEYTRLNTNLTTFTAYSADIAQRDCDYKQTAKGAPIKLGNDYSFAAYIEHMIQHEKYSPDALIGKLRREDICFDTRICTRTLYSYIYKGVFGSLTANDLLRNGKRQPRTHEPSQRIVKPLNRSIDERPNHVSERAEFGHWEADTVIGKANARPCLLVLTERKTRYEMIFKLRRKTQSEVRRCFNKLERDFSNFSDIFKTVTCDNGSEFLNASAIEKSRKGTKQRTVVYYCHPYSSYERGSNENANSIIRRFISKGSDMTPYSNKRISEIQHWINHYPRKVLGYASSAELFEKELSNIYFRKTT